MKAETMASGEDLRRRPVRPEKVPLVDREVEISELEEDEKLPHLPHLEDRVDGDPLVLKGSRLTGPPKKLAEGEVIARVSTLESYVFNTVHRTT